MTAVISGIWFSTSALVINITNIDDLVFDIMMRNTMKFLFIT